MSNRIWIYQADRLMTDQEEATCLEAMSAFSRSWEAHHKKLSSNAQVLHKLFLIFEVDESLEIPTGCSIDDSVKLVRQLAETLEIDFFNRLKVAVRLSDKNIDVLDLVQLQEAMEEGIITGESIVFNNLVATSDELKSSWQVQLKDSWVARKVLQQQ